MKHVINTAAGALAITSTGDVALDKPKGTTLCGGDIATDVFQIGRMAGGKIVETHNALIKTQQRLDQVRPNETGSTSDEPFFWPTLERRTKLLVCRFCQSCAQSRNPGMPSELVAIC